MLTDLHTSERGQGLVEYALILVLVAVAIIIILGLTGNQLAVKFCDITIQLGGKAPDSIAACRAPRVTISGLVGNQTVSGLIAVEAIVKNNQGQVTATDHTFSVDFNIDGHLIRTETIYRFCLGGGDSSCDAAGGTPYDTHNLSNGAHVLHVVVTDNRPAPLGGGTGDVSFTFFVAN